MTEQILIIEQSLSLSRCYQAYLSQLACISDSVHDVSSAVNALENKVPDVILLDFHLVNGGADIVMQKLSTIELPSSVILMVDQGGGDW